MKKPWSKNNSDDAMGNDFGKLLNVLFPRCAEVGLRDPYSVLAFI